MPGSLDNAATADPLTSKVHATSASGGLVLDLRRAPRTETGFLLGRPPPKPTRLGGDFLCEHPLLSIVALPKETTYQDEISCMDVVFSLLSPYCFFSRALEDFACDS
jgi:hypothetical protein